MWRKVFQKVFDCFLVANFKIIIINYWLLRTTPSSLRTGLRAGYMIGIHPKASGFRLDLVSFLLRADFLWDFLPVAYLSIPPPLLSLSLALSPCPRGVYSTMCHCSGQGNVDPGRGSLLRPERPCCVGLCGTFVCVFRGSYVVWCGEASRDHGGAPHWEEGTNYSDYMWPADWCLRWWFLGSRGERWNVHLCKSFSIMFIVFSWQMESWYYTCFWCTCLGDP